MTLSVPQKNLLALICEKPRNVVEYYAPAKKLVELGLAEWRGTKTRANYLDPTDAGRALQATIAGEAKP